MVDVGPGAGALVIYAAEPMHGQEIEISPAADDSQRTHTDVLRRKVAGGYVFAAVFGSLAPGTYRLWHESFALPRQVTVANGEVSEVDWR